MVDAGRHEAAVALHCTLTACSQQTGARRKSGSGLHVNKARGGVDKCWSNEGLGFMLLDVLVAGSRH